LAVAHQRRQRTRHCRLRVAARHDNDDIGSVDSQAEIARRTLDGGEPRLLAFDIDAAKGSNIGEARVVNVVQSQLVPGNSQFRRKVDAANSGPDDRNRLDRNAVRHEIFPSHRICRDTHPIR
jgi:hypothetical protein